MSDTTNVKTAEDPFDSFPTVNADDYPAILEVECDDGGPPTLDFISTYARYADVLEAPRQMHEAVATVLVAAVLNGKVHIKWGGIEIPLDLWMLLLSGSGLGRNTLVGLARPVLREAGLSQLVRNTFWGSSQAFYQQAAEHPEGFFVWPEFSAVMKRLDDRRFAGVQEWLTDRFDNFDVPPAIKYRVTGKKADTPPIEFERAPRLNILATSSFDWFVNSLRPEDAAGGFVPRWLLLRVQRPFRTIPKPRRTDEALIKPLADALRRAHELKGVADLSQVERMYARWYRDTKKRFEQQPNQALAAPFFNRLRTHVLKLALIYEVSQSGSLKVSPRAMRRAIKAATNIEKTIFDLLPTGMSREGAEVDKMAERVRLAGAEGLSLSGFTRAFQHIRLSDRQTRVRTLIQAGTVQHFVRQTPGRQALVFVHKDYLEAHAQQYPEDKELA